MTSKYIFLFYGVYDGWIIGGLFFIFLYRERKDREDGLTFGHLRLFSVMKDRKEGWKERARYSCLYFSICRKDSLGEIFISRVGGFTGPLIRSLRIAHPYTPLVHLQLPVLPAAHRIAHYAILSKLARSLFVTDAPHTTIYLIYSILFLFVQSWLVLLPMARA